MNKLNALLPGIPGFESKRYCSLWFAASTLAVLFGVWCAYTWLRSGNDPAHYGIEPNSVVRLAWAFCAIAFGWGGFTGLWLGVHRLRATSKT